MDHGRHGSHGVSYTWWICPACSRCDHIRELPPSGQNSSSSPVRFGSQTFLISHHAGFTEGTTLGENFYLTLKVQGAPFSDC